MEERDDYPIIPQTKGSDIAKRREEMTRETWIKNVMRVEGYTRQKAEEAYERIVKPFSDNK